MTVDKFSPFNAIILELSKIVMGVDRIDKIVLGNQDRLMELEDIAKKLHALWTDGAYWEDGEAYNGQLEMRIWSWSMTSAQEWRRALQAELRTLIGEPVDGEYEQGDGDLRVYIGDGVQIQYKNEIICDPIDATRSALIQHALDIIRHKYKPDVPMLGKRCTYILCQFNPCKPMLEGK